MEKTNRAHFSNPEVSRLLEQLVARCSFEEVQGIFQQAKPMGQFIFAWLKIFDNKFKIPESYVLYHDADHLYQQVVLIRDAKEKEDAIHEALGHLENETLLVQDDIKAKLASKQTPVPDPPPLAREDLWADETEEDRGPELSSDSDDDGDDDGDDDDDDDDDDADGDDEKEQIDTESLFDTADLDPMQDAGLPQKGPHKRPRHRGKDLLTLGRGSQRPITGKRHTTNTSKNEQAGQRKKTRKRHAGTAADKDTPKTAHQEAPKKDAAGPPKTAQRGHPVYSLVDQHQTAVNMYELVFVLSQPAVASPETDVLLKTRSKENVKALHDKITEMLGRLVEKKRQQTMEPDGPRAIVGQPDLSIQVKRKRQDNEKGQEQEQEPEGESSTAGGMPFPSLDGTMRKRARKGDGEIAGMPGSFLPEKVFCELIDDVTNMKRQTARLETAVLNGANKVRDEQNRLKEVLLSGADKVKAAQDQATRDAKLARHSFDTCVELFGRRLATDYPMPVPKITYHF